MNEQDYKILVDCIELAKRSDETEFYRMKEATPEHIEAALREALFELNDDVNSLDLTYQIANSALNVLYEVEYKDLPAFDVYEHDGEYASVYTADRLGYLNSANQQEISDKIREYDCDDIATAAAIWYDEKVKELVAALKAKILPEHD